MRILAVFAHPDDEIGCIGTLAKHAARGDEVMLVWTTLGELASQFGAASHEEVTRVRAEHGAWVAERIGARHHFFDMGDSRMTGGRDEALQLARLYARFRPDAVITWDDYSAHPDHRVTAKIVFDAVTLARIPKIVNEGLGDEERLDAHRAPVRIYQYHHPLSEFPSVTIDTSEFFEVGRDVARYYRDFYKWQWSDEQYLATREAAGRAASVKYGERFNLRAAHLPASAYLG
ncbi:PIG-L deacetylase family protein [Deinococcus yavapaiensis]|uniref:LmbE family N-acetylglucosaminyl deacetylase n=1 Tax=Deinococcus yavapaiensis KR-236 TaxID=694435 RepID=A0A318SGB7_9DEIO|nr:PIG-L deacetylase family protein [Deinococcus yavapaiensis]PYE56434.1 LmbE family N-acetylglucosaminyl deacetylase [Deinococcus yavapaiensis KR-236]